MYYFVIENKETEERFLISFKEWNKNGIPKGFARITSCLPLPKKYEDLPILKQKLLEECKMVRCKFKCELNELLGDTSRIRLTPIFADGNEENKKFFKYTPGGNIDLQVVNPEAAKQFEVGKEYYIDFTPVK